MLQEKKSLKFTKSQRLLTAFDYQEVFTKQTFCYKTHSFTLLAKENSCNHPRLGIVVSKRNAKLATQRNRIKRIIRESFRINQHLLPGVDLVILSKPALNNVDNKDFFHNMEQCYQKLVNFYSKK